MLQVWNYVLTFFFIFHAAAGYERVETPVSFGPRMSSTPLVPHSHTPPLHYMTPSVCCDAIDKYH